MNTATNNIQKLIDDFLAGAKERAVARADKFDRETNSTIALRVKRAIRESNK